MNESPEERIKSLESRANQLVPAMMQIHGSLQKNAEVKLQRTEMDILAELTAYVAELSKRVTELENK